MDSQLQPLRRMIDLSARWFAGLALVVSLVFLPGCQTSPETNQSVSVELPDSTPFDSNVLARNAYLDSYESGYRSASRGGPISTDFLPGPYRFARELGWRAGASAAQVAAEERSIHSPPR